MIHCGNHVSWYYEQILGGKWDRDHFLRGNSDTTYHCHEGGSPLWGIYGTLEGVRRPGLGQWTQNYRGVWGWSQGFPDSMDVPGTAHHGGQDRRLYWPSLQGIPRSYPCIPHVPHAFQLGRGRHHTPLGDGWGRNWVVQGETWPVNAVLGGVFLCQWWTHCVNPTGEDAVVVQLPQIASLIGLASGKIRGRRW